MFRLFCIGTLIIFATGFAKSLANSSCLSSVSCALRFENVMIKSKINVEIFS
jgi:hypothetical protein